jgi:hypothetical protein
MLASDTGQIGKCNALATLGSRREHRAHDGVGFRVDGDSGGLAPRHVRPNADAHVHRVRAIVRSR